MPREKIWAGPGRGWIYVETFQFGGRASGKTFSQTQEWGWIGADRSSPIVDLDPSQWKVISRVSR